MHLQPGVGEHSQHGRVLTQRLCGEGVQAAAVGQRDQVLQQQHADAAVVHVIGDRQGDLGRLRRRTAALVTAAADQLAVQQGEQRGVVRRGLTAEPTRFPLGRARTHAEEAQVETVRGQLLVHIPHRVQVVRPGGLDLNRGAVGQQGVNTGPGVCAHVALPVLRRLTGAAPTSIMSYRNAAHRDSACVSLPPGGQQLAHGHEDVPGVGHGPDQTVELLHEGGVRQGTAVVREHDAAGGVPPQYLVDVDTRASAPRARLLHDHVPRRARSQATNRVMAETARFTNVRHGPRPANRDRGCRLPPPGRHW